MPLPRKTPGLWAALRAGGHVALVRHGATAGGAGDPPGFRLDDCATHSGTVSEATEQRAKTYARESLEDIWAGYDAMLQHRGLVIGSPAWCRYMGVLWFNS